jgi:transcriptional regulator with XRE-family HTH domain
MAELQTFSASPDFAAEPTSSINIGTTIRTYRLQKGMSQGDIEKRTGLLRCYLSRVENGHTVPSLETLQKIAHALDNVGTDMSTLRLSEEEIRFLTQIQRYAARLSENDRKLLLAMVRKFAQTTMA